MRALLDELRAIVRDAQRSQIPIAVIGACALRTYLRSPDRRTTVDADVLTTRAAADPLDAILAQRGYRTFSNGPWRRAERDDRTMIDVAVDGIVDVGTFVRYDIDWSTVRVRGDLPVPRLEDLVAQKLISAREKDLLDVVLVASDAATAFDGGALKSELAHQDVEIPVMRGCIELEASVRSGRMAQLWTERYGDEVPFDLNDIVQRIRAWLEAEP